ncbi:hypothetical protein ACFXAF_00420 [Kitasatospora sp. NPDC059463]|uniref:hypothetical protein n=1 Tax=unclassified Kitasatospora TaxID=2633591 RepID=UPI00367D9489
MTWCYELYVCESAGVDHGDDCAQWTLAGQYFDHGYRDAFVAATAEQHAEVRTVSPFTGNTTTPFRHIEGGGLCEWCGPATGRRGPWMHTPNEDRFMCSACVADGEASLEVMNKASGWYSSRSYWPVLEGPGLS